MSNEEKRNKSIKKIKKAALKLFSEKGYANSTVSQIAKEAEISKGLIYNYFESKEELLKKIFLEGLLDLFPEEKFVKLFSITDPKERLVQLINTTYIVTEVNIQFVKIYLEMLFQPIVEENITKESSVFINKFYEQSARIFKELELPEYDKESKILVALLNGVQLHYVTNPEKYTLKKTIELIKKKYLDKIENLNRKILE